MKTKVHLVRHGEVHNPNKVYYGRIPGYFLSEKGKEQVHKLGKHLKGKPIKKIYTSPLDRTKETASIICEYFSDIEITHDERLLEVNSPPLEGKLLQELEKFQFNFYLDEFVIQGGERINDIKNRMTHFLEEIVLLHPDEEIVVVSHGDPIMITRSHFANKYVDLSTIRGNNYIETAHGVELLFEENSVTVNDIIPV